MTAPEWTPAHFDGHPAVVEARVRYGTGVPGLLNAFDALADRGEFDLSTMDCLTIRTGAVLRGRILGGEEPDYSGEIPTAILLSLVFGVPASGVHAITDVYPLTSPDRWRDYPYCRALAERILWHAVRDAEGALGTSAVPPGHALSQPKARRGGTSS